MLDSYGTFIEVGSKVAFSYAEDAYVYLSTVRKIDGEDVHLHADDDGVVVRLASEVVVVGPHVY